MHTSHREFIRGLEDILVPEALDVNGRRVLWVILEMKEDLHRRLLLSGVWSQRLAMLKIGCIYNGSMENCLSCNAVYPLLKKSRVLIVISCGLEQR